MKRRWLFLALMLPSFLIATANNGRSEHESGKEPAKSANSSSADAANSIYITPNPVQDKAVIRLSIRSKEYTVVDLYNDTGHYVRTIQEGHLHDGRATVFINTEHYEEGSYFLKVSSGETEATQEIVIKR